MKVKRYFASNMRSALDLIRQEQGPDVLILSNRKVDGGVELVTADGVSEQEAAALVARGDGGRRAEAAAAAATPPAIPAAAARSHAGAGAATSTGSDLLWTDAGTVAQMREELRSLKGLLESQLSGLAWSEFGSRHPLRARLMRVLAQVGIAAPLARELVAEVPDELDYRAGWHRVLALLMLRLNVLNDPVLRHGGRFALLGPTGVGKTLLTSKIAARTALTHGADSVAIVSMDDHRLGAHQQMKAFGRLIGSPVYTLRTADELPAVVAENAARRLLIIDTPGSGPGTAQQRALTSAISHAGTDIQLIGVLSATTDYLSARSTLRGVAELPFDACIVTKLDEAASFGPALSAVIETGLPLAYTSAGQRVPDDLDRADPRALIEAMVARAKTMPAADDASHLEQAFVA